MNLANIKNETIKQLKSLLKYFILTLILTIVLIFAVKNIGAIAISAQNMTGINAASWIALTGVMIGQFMALSIREYEKIIDKKYEKQQGIKMTETIINNFLSKEISYNLKMIPIKDMQEKYIIIKENPNNKKLYIGSLGFKFIEFDKVKYEIIKYSNDLTIEVLEVYNLFYFLMDKKGFTNMSIEEIEKFFSVYDKHVDKYSIKI